ncbi:MAG: hypothetical protein A2252_01660 [Elusimicrobia bacterium RIFOXYA2_FULL_39_19]|nr:MAG: hypothetical protein A2252_01660 [Elusimicrobia bacterium RIFOXYA2_FULL_39_19]
MNFKTIIAGLIIAISVAVLISPFASNFPDGLEKFAEDKGFIHLGENKVVVSAPLPDYTVPGMKNEGIYEAISTSLSGLAGVIIVFISTYSIGRLIARKKGK